MPSLTTLKEWIRATYRTEQEIKELIKPVIQAKLQPYTPTNELLERFSGNDRSECG